MLPHPGAAARFNLRFGRGMDRPVIKGALARRLGGDVPPPVWLAVNHRQVRRHVTAFKKLHPEMSRRGMGFVIGLGPENTAANPHALEIDDRLGENRKPWRLGAVWPSLKPLAVRHHKLIVDPAVRRIPLPGVAVL